MTFIYLIKHHLHLDTDRLHQLFHRQKMRPLAARVLLSLPGRRGAHKSQQPGSAGEQEVSGGKPTRSVKTTFKNAVIIRTHLGMIGCTFFIFWGNYGEYGDPSQGKTRINQVKAHEAGFLKKTMSHKNPIV